MASTIKIKNSSTASAVPTSSDLVQGELAVNVTDKRIFTENASGTVVELGINPSSLTMTGGTANGVAYLNGSKVVTSGSALVFDGTNLGVGTSSPAYKLDVNIASGSVRVRSNTATANSAGYLLGNSLRAWSMLSESGAGNFIISDETTAGTPTRLTIDSSGNLGLGVTPSAGSGRPNFNVGGAGSGLVGTTGNIDLVSSAYYAGGWKNGDASYKPTRIDISDGVFSWNTASVAAVGTAITWTTPMTLDASGRLGVGTTSPNALVHAAGASGTNCYYQIAQTGVESWTMGMASSSSALAFANSGVERARIDTSGNLLVGKTSASAFTTAGTEINASGFVAITRSGSTALLLNRETNNGEVAQFRRSNTTVGSIDVTTTATSYVTSSDYRLKNTVAPMTGALSKVAALKPVTYKWNVDGSDGEGFIAHELAEVCPHAVTGVKDAINEDGTPKYQGIDTSFLVATLTAAIQEQQAIIISLTARIEALEA